MAVTTVVRITHDKLEHLGLSQPTGSSREVCERLSQLLIRLGSGNLVGTVDVQRGATAAVKASATATLATAIATNAVTINAVAFTAVASGATGNQWNIGGTDTISATNLAAAINGSVTAKIAGYVSATSSGAVVTISAVTPGLLGNLVTLTKTGTPITVTGAGFLASGAGDDVAVVSYSRS